MVPFLPPRVQSAAKIANTCNVKGILGTGITIQAHTAISAAKKAIWVISSIVNFILFFFCSSMGSPPVNCKCIFSNIYNYKDSHPIVKLFFIYLYNLFFFCGKRKENLL